MSFTGNRFEFRAAGSSANCAASMIVINAAMAHQLNEFKTQIDKLVNGGMEQEEALYKVLKETIIASQNIRFEGDGYSEEWKAEAARRGLTNICHVPEAILKFNDEQSRAVLIGEKIFNENELFCRIEVELEKFTKKVQIESTCTRRSSYQSYCSHSCNLSEQTIRKSSWSRKRYSPPKNTKS